MYVHSTGKLLVARDVTILEGEFPGGKPTEPAGSTELAEPVSRLIDLESTPPEATRATSEDPGESSQPASPEAEAETLSQHSGSSTSADELAFLLSNSPDQQNKDPVSCSEAMQSPDKANWQLAMQKEINDLGAQSTWQLTKLPASRKALKGRWVYKTKQNPDGSINKFKARWVAKGFSQKYGVDYTETFSSTMKFMVLRTLFALAAYLGLECHQIDIKSAFPNAPINEEIYVEQPHGFVTDSTLVCRLNKALYGLKQSARQWYKFLAGLLKQLGFSSISSDQSVFYNSDTETIVASHIDDLLIFGSISLIQQLKEDIAAKVEITDLGPISYYLGIEIARSPGQISISQQKYTTEILAKFGKSDLKPVKSPSEMGVRLEKSDQVADEQTTRSYQQQIGSLMYLMVATRPDLAYSVSQAARFMSSPSSEHFQALDRIWKYLVYTKNSKLVFSSTSAPVLTGYCDSDWGGDFSTRKSTTGYLFCLGDTAISWSSKLQSTIALSSCEAEYMALKEAVKELLWLQYVLG